LCADKAALVKTTLARTLDGNSTLFMDLEAGDAAIEGHNIDVNSATDMAGMP
jgi:hypothetical protein